MLAVFPRCNRSHPPARRRGEVLVEFAFVAITLYLLLAGIIEFGRALFAAQVLQQAADTAARELSRMPLPVASTSPLTNTLTGDNGILRTNALVKQTIYDERYLIVDVQNDLQGGSIAPADFFADKPILNRLLMPLMIYDNSSGTNLFRYPGQIVADTGVNGGFTVVIPIVDYQGGTDAVIRTVPVVEEITQDPNYSNPNYDFHNPNPNFSPFNLLAANLTSPAQAGFIALRINYPFQAATLSSFQTVNGQQTPTTTTEVGDTDINAGAAGLGRQNALGKTVRPFRKVLSAQAIFRREIFE
jgi:hypothetical protein